MTTHYPLTQINITGYRRLFSIEMKMRPLMVMIGANGVGKTSVLDVFSLLTSAAQGKLKNILSRFKFFYRKNLNLELNLGELMIF